MDNIEGVVKKVVAEMMGVDPETVKLESRLDEDLKADSLDKVELVMALEEEFEREISDEDAGKIKTVGEIVAYLSVPATTH